jgi:hypothetical protein
VPPAAWPAKVGSKKPNTIRANFLDLKLAK